MFKGKDFKKNILPYLVSILAFYAISLFYCSPVLEGKQLFQTDTRKGAGMGQDMKEYSEKTGEKSLWTGSAFGGMPAYQISPGYKAFPLMKVKRVFEGFLPSPASQIFLYLLGFFMLMCAFGLNPWIGLVSAIAFAFSSYFFIIITAGHMWKAWVIGLIPPTMAGIVWAYKKKYLLGGAVFALFFALQLMSNHIQMTYYFFVFIGLPYLIYELVNALKKKALPNFMKASGMLLIGAILAVGINATSLFFTAKYSKDTIRGKSELTVTGDLADKTSGLDKSYATDWSYGVAETFSLLIPDAKGGGNAPIGNSERVMKNVPSALQNDVANSDRYWGDQPFTAGPVYVGAFVLFLFILGLFIVDGGLKWAMLVATVFSILLSWGKNFMPLTDFFLNYFPMYNKFRSVSSILVVAEICIPILAAFSLAEIIKKPEILKKKATAFYISIAATAGLTLLFWLMPKTFFNFFPQKEVEQFAGWIQQNPGAESQINMYMAGLEAARVAIFKADAIRSFIIIALGVALIYLYSKGKLKKGLTIASVLLLVLIDMWSIDKRYLNNDCFLPKRETMVAWPMTEADKAILQDKDLGYRVINLTVDPFRDASTSFYHRSVGGYHAAKLRRYQELIEHYFSTNVNMPILNMLNTRYFIVANEQKQPIVQRNPDALGAAWFVEKFRMVKNADEEIAAIGNFDPKNELIVDQRFKDQLADKTFVKDTSSRIDLVEYAPNRLLYKTKSSAEQLAVFSEIYYADGWKATIDGKEVPHFRANYVLRAMVIPAGEHTIEFKFIPESFNKIESMSMIALAGLVLFILAAIMIPVISKRNKRLK